MRPFWLLFAAAASLIGATTNAPPPIRGNIRGVAVLGDELVLAGEKIALEHDQTSSPVAVWDGSRLTPLAASLRGHVANVFAIAVLGNELVIGGVFESVNQTTAANVARWDGSQWRPLGAGLGPAGEAVAVGNLVFFQGALYASGTFNRSGNQRVPGIARWNGSSWISLANEIGISDDDNWRFQASADDRMLCVYAYHTDRFNNPPVLACFNGREWFHLAPVPGLPAQLLVHNGELYVVGHGSSLALDPSLGHKADLNRIAKWTNQGWLAPFPSLPEFQLHEFDFLSLAYVGDVPYALGWFADRDLAAHLMRWESGSWSHIPFPGGASYSFADLYPGTANLWLVARRLRQQEKTLSDVLAWDNNQWRTIARDTPPPNVIEVLVRRTARLLLIVTGLLFLYIAFFLSETAEGVVQSRLERYWVTIDDVGKSALSLEAVMLRNVLNVTLSFFDQWLGPNMWNGRSGGVCYTLAGFLVALFYFRGAKTFFGKTSGPHIILGLLMTAFLALAIWPAFASWTRARIYWGVAVIALSVVHASVWPIFARDIFSGQLLAGAVLMIYLSFTRWTLAVATHARTAWKIIGLFVTSTFVAALTIAIMFAPSWIYLLNRYAPRWLYWLSVPTLTAGGGLVYFASLLTVVEITLSASILLHHFCWPVISVPLYSLQRHGLLRQRKLLGSIGFGLLVCGLPGLSLLKDLRMLLNL